MADEKKRRKRGYGTIEEMKNGTFRPRLPGAGARLRACATYEEAERLLNSALHGLQETNTQEVEGMTLRKWGEDVPR